MTTTAAAPTASLVPAAAAPTRTADRRLPPPGGDSSEIAQFVDLLVAEAHQDDRRTAWEQQSEEGLNQYLGYQWRVAGPGGQWETAADNDGFIRLVLNRTQNCVMGLMAIQAGDPPKVTFTARESGDRPVVFLNTKNPAGQALAGRVAAEASAGGHAFDPAAPLEDDVAQAVRQEIAEAQLMVAQLSAAGLPVPPELPTADAIVEVSEYEATQAMQTVFDAMWEEADGHYAFVENVLNKNILGWQPTLYEFDDERKRHVLKNVHAWQVHVEPTEPNYLFNQYTVYDEPIGADEACGLYPHLAGKIREWVQTGTLNFPGSRSYSPGYRYRQRFERDMVVIRHAWIRNQSYPMTADEAVKGGKVKAGQVETGFFSEQPDELGGVRQVPETRPAYFHPATGEEVTPAAADGGPNPAWPTKRLTRQVRVIANEVVDDRPSEFADVPVPWNVNLSIPYCPYGQGEPMRLKGMQDALNYVLSCLVTYAAYNATPPEVIDSEIEKLMPEALRQVRTRPNQRVVIPHQALADLGGDIKKLIGTLDPATMPADFWKLLDFLVQMIDREGNMADVLQGDASSSWSGDAIAHLQNAASQVVRAKSMMTEFYLKRVARLMVHSILTRMTPADWSRYCRKYPAQALEALHAKALAVDVNIAVEIKSGSGASKAQQQQNVLAARAAGLPVSPQTAMEQIGLKPDVELKQTMEWMRQTQAAGAAAGAPAAPGAPTTNNGAPAAA